MAKQKYFSHDSNARNDEKIVNMRMCMGVEGYAIYFMILERLREAEDFMGVKDYNAIAFDLRVDAKDVKRVVEEFGLFQFTEDGKLFYSESFRDRMRIMESKRIKQVEAGKRTAAMRWESGGGVTNLPNGSNSPIGNLSGKSNLPITNLSESGNLPIESKENEKERTKEKDKDEKNKTKKKIIVEPSTKAEDSMSDFQESADAASAVSPSLFGDEVVEEKTDRFSHEDVINFWNTVTGGVYGKLIRIDNNRLTMTLARIREYGMEAFYQAIRNAAASEYLKTVPWFNYDWMIRPNNFVKVFEDKYGKRERTESAGSSGLGPAGLEAANSVRLDGEQGGNVKPVRKRIYD